MDDGRSVRGNDIEEHSQQLPFEGFTIANGANLRSNRQEAIEITAEAIVFAQPGLVSGVALECILITT